MFVANLNKHNKIFLIVNPWLGHRLDRDSITTVFVWRCRKSPNFYPQSLQKWINFVGIQQRSQMKIWSMSFFELLFVSLLESENSAYMTIGLNDVQYFSNFFCNWFSRPCWIFDIKVTGNKPTKPKFHVIGCYSIRTINKWLAFSFFYFILADVHL